MSNLTERAHLTDAAVKSSGSHYTPPELADFLAERAIHYLPPHRGPIRVLDPACGNGNLLSAIVRRASSSQRRRLVLVGYDSDSVALEQARAELSELPVSRLDLVQGDFL